MPVVVTEQRTTVTSSGGRFSMCTPNFGYLRTLDGWLKLAQIVLGFITLALIVSFDRYQLSWARFLTFTSFAYSVMTCLILLSAMGSATGLTLVATMFYLNYHITGFVFYLSGGLTCVINAAQYRDLGQIIAAGVLGLLLAALYAIDIALTFRARG
ncbi:uncharacterized protein LOC135378322 [Ornithodoros turicata]|uniref:Putative members of chemokine-like factor super family n=1 Tax=Ornithodoros turicata TaxID=34597 RepID=A0A2R5LDL1_9ACAR